MPPPTHTPASNPQRVTVSLSARSGKATLGACVLGSALAYMSDDMLNVALPTLSRDLSVGVTELQWVVNGYFLTLLSLLLTAGSIGDVRGHRRTFLGGLGAFGVGAIACATAPAVPLLVAGRAIQGLGAAFLLASGLALINGSFDDRERGRAVGLYMGMTAIATAAGPALGGVLVEALSWRAIFVAPLLFPAAAAVVTILWVPDMPATSARRPKARDAVVAFATIAAFSFALIQGPTVGPRPEVLAAAVTAIVGAVMFVSIQRRATDPMLPLDLFRNRTFSGGNAATLAAYTASAGAFFFLVIQLQSTLGLAPAAAGAAMMPVYLIMLVGSPLAGRLADRVGARIPVVAGLVAFAAGLLWLSLVHAGSALLTDVFPGMVVFSVGLAGLGAPLTAATLAAAGEEDQGIASGINNLVGQLAGLLMIAALPAAAGLAGEGLEGPAFAEGYARGMRLCAAVALLAAAIAAATLRGEGSRSRT